jgi:hypothetical protein
MTEQQPFRVETVVDAPPEAVWAALTTPEQLREWFGWDHDGIDAEIRYIFVEHVKLAPPTQLLFENASSIELVPSGERTVLRAVMPGPDGSAASDAVHDEIAEGWRAFFAQLRFLLETHPRGRRRTIYLTGEATGEELASLTAGRLWHEGRYQRGLVDPNGHLVVLASQRPLADAAPAAVSVTVTTHGLDDAAYSAIRDGWVARWETVARHPDVTP